MAGLRQGTAAEAGLSARHLSRARDLAAEWVKDVIAPTIKEIAPEQLWWQLDLVANAVAAAIED